MGERKVINHYVSPDFDPSIIPRTKKDKSAKTEVRTMIPFSMRCNTCNEYMYLGKKFNCKMERLDEKYMTTRILRFYIKCCVCSAEITYKTDPKNSGYTLESGASRNFELWRDTEQAVEEAKREREQEEEQDAMKKLENRTMDNKAEMDTLDALDEMRAINQRHERVDTKALLATLQAGGAASLSAEAVGSDGLTEAERAQVRAAYAHRNRAIDSDDEVEVPGAQAGRDVAAGLAIRAAAAAAAAGQGQAQGSFGDAAGVTIVRKKRKLDQPPAAATITAAAPSVHVSVSVSVPVPAAAAGAGAGLAGLCAYGSDSD